MLQGDLPWQVDSPAIYHGNRCRAPCQATDVDQYCQRMRFLQDMWPPEHLSLLGPRAALMVFHAHSGRLASQLEKGTSFRRKPERPVGKDDGGREVSRL